MGAPVAHSDSFQSSGLRHIPVALAYGFEPKPRRDAPGSCPRPLRFEVEVLRADMGSSSHLWWRGTHIRP